MSDGPIVGILVGSESDREGMQGAIDELATPLEMAEYGRSARARGLRVIVAGAGGAAHLPGMLAAHTPLPVIGVPVSVTALNGLDALLSIVQMPPGVPVACVGVDNARNAAVLAARILGLAS